MRTRKTSGMAWRHRWPDHAGDPCRRVTLKAWSISTRCCPCWRNSRTLAPSVIGPATANCSTTSTSAFCCCTSLVPQLRACVHCSRLLPSRPLNVGWAFGRRRWAPLAKPRGCLTPRHCTKSSGNWQSRRCRLSTNLMRTSCSISRPWTAVSFRISSHGMGPLERLRTSRR